MLGKQVGAGREAFLAQFEEVDGGTHFRPGGVGEPFALTVEEQHAATALFEQQVRRLYCVMMGILIGSLGLLVWASLEMAFSIELATGVLVVLIAVGFSLAFRRALHAPARQFARRQVPGESRTKTQVRAAHLRNTSWASFGFGAAGIVAIGWKVLSKAEAGSGEFWFWLLFVGAGFLVVLVQAIRKMLLPTDD